ncbi:hypothetical protein Lser_V15G23007 [Lactuca serriola]
MAEPSRITMFRRNPPFISSSVFVAVCRSFSELQLERPSLWKLKARSPLVK